MKFFNYDNPIMCALGRICDIMILNILWVLCSLPLITMGAASAALYYCLFRMREKTDSSVSRMFFMSFRQNLKQGCVMTVIFALSGMVLFLDISISKNLEGTFGIVLRTVFYLFSVIWGMMVSCAFPLLARFENSIVGTLKNSFIMSVGYFKKTVVILLLNLVAAIPAFWGMDAFVLCMPVFLVFGIAVIAFINTKILGSVFDYYIKPQGK